jgi:hypothetical protein
MDVIFAFFIISASSLLLGFVLGQAYQQHLNSKRRMELDELRRHIRESNERAS